MSVATHPENSSGGTSTPTGWAWPPGGTPRPTGWAWQACNNLIHPTTAQFVESLRAIGVVACWDVTSFVWRPASYVLLLALTLVAGWNFSLLTTVISGGRVLPLLPADDPVLQFLGPNVFLVFSIMLALPLLTAELIAEERRRGSWENLLTAPVDAGHIVIGKFLAAWCRFQCCWMPWLLFLIVLRFSGSGLSFDLGPLAGSVIGWMTIGLTLSALGLFCSALSQTAVSAAITTFLAMTIVLLLSLLPGILELRQISAAWIARAEWLSVWGHLSQFSQGRIDPRLVAGHISVTVCLLWLTAHSARRN